MRCLPGTYGIHGGDVETSLMLAFNPHCVDMSHAKNFRSSAESASIPPIGPISRGWIASDLNEDGTVGDATLATAEKGEATAKYQVDGFIDMLKQVEKAEIPSAPATL